MKWNILIASMVLGLGLSTQSFGFELLDRMLGSNDCCQKDGCAQKDGSCQKDGCCQKDSKGCEQKGCAPKCCRRPLLSMNLCAQKSCGSDKGCAQKDGCGDKGCGQKDGCCQKDDGKGCAQKGCGSGLGLGIFQKSCGSDKGCCQKDDGKGCCQKDDGKGCAQKGCAGPSLLDRIFSRSCCSGKGAKGGCDSKGSDKCGCGSSQKDDKAGDVIKAEASDDAPVPPAPVVDASAFMQSQQRILQASTTLVR